MRHGCGRKSAPGLCPGYVSTARKPASSSPRTPPAGQREGSSQEQRHPGPWRPLRSRPPRPEMAMAAARGCGVRLIRTPRRPRQGSVGALDLARLDAAQTGGAGREPMKALVIGLDPATTRMPRASPFSAATAPRRSGPFELEELTLSSPQVRQSSHAAPISPSADRWQKKKTKRTSHSRR